MEQGSEPTPGNICYAPSNTIAGDLICRFIDSDIAAVIRMKGNVYVLVGRAMVLGIDQDISIFAQGMEEPSQSMLTGGGETISLDLTLDELRELTFPPY
jgi:hypothetical protein